MKYTILIFFVLVLFSACSSHKSEQNQGVEDSPESRPYYEAGDNIIDFPELLAKSAEQNKHIILYFSGYGCVNCRRMEDVLFKYPGIEKMLNNDFIFVPLNVDSRAELIDSEIIMSKVSEGKQLKTVGNVNSELQIILTQTGTQPVLAMLDKEGKLLKKQGFSLKGEEYKAFFE